LSITDANGHTTEFTYNLGGEQTRKTWADGTFQEYIYDAAGNLIQLGLEDNHANAFFVDDMNRVERAAYFDGTEYRFFYTPTGNIDYVTDAAGNVLNEYVYDARGNLMDKAKDSL
jgi:YD repeat-containing protein